MKLALQSLTDRALAVFLPKTDASACTISYCRTTSYLLGEPGCEWVYTQSCYSSSGQLCYSDSYCG